MTTLLGGNDDDDDDGARDGGSSVAALTCASDGATWRVVCLRADAEAELWTAARPADDAAPREVRPTSVRRLALAPEVLPSFSLWSTAPDAVRTACGLFGRSSSTYCAAVAVATLPGTPVSLIVLHGDVDDDDHDAHLSLTLPPGASSLIDLSFAPDPRCELRCLFADADGRAVPARYPPSLTALLSRTPEENGDGGEGSLETWTERHEFTADPTSDDAGARLRALFRPSSLGPVDELVLVALEATAPADALVRDATLSAPARVLATMETWERRGSRSDATTTAGAPVSETNDDDADPDSVYHAFAASSRKKRSREDAEGDTTQSSSSASADRWNRLFAAARREHALRLLAPLRLLVLPRAEGDEEASPTFRAMTVRSGVTTAWVERETKKEKNNNNDTGDVGTLDAAARSLSTSASSTLDRLELRASKVAATASLLSTNDDAEGSPTGFTREIERAAREVFETLDPESAEAARRLVSRDLDDDALTDWADGASGVAKDSDETTTTMSVDPSSSSSGPSPDHLGTVRHLVRLRLRAVRRGAAARCLLLAGCGGADRAFRRAAHAWLHAAAVDWVVDQTLVAGERVACATWEDEDGRGAEEEGRLEGRTVCDAYASILLSNGGETSDLRSSFARASRAADALLRDALTTRRRDGGLARPLFAGRWLTRRWGRPRLALRLLAPAVAFSNADDDGVAAADARVAAAEAALVEARATDDPGPLRTRAARLHAEADRAYDRCYGSYDDVASAGAVHHRADAVWTMMTKGVREWWTCDELPEEERRRRGTTTTTTTTTTDTRVFVEERLREMMGVVPNEDDGFVDPVRRAARSPTCRALVLSWVHTRSRHEEPATLHLPLSAADDPSASVRFLLHRLRSAAHAADLLALVERHAPDDHAAAAARAECAAAAWEAALPRRAVPRSPETAALRGAAFRHAAAAGDWDRAARAARRAPAGARRRACARRLVAGCARRGALGALLRAARDDARDDPIDPDGAAAALLGERRGADADDDLHGCLYALRASRGDWRRAAEAADARRRRAEANAGEGDALDVAAACAAAARNAVALVRESKHRFVAVRDDDRRTDDATVLDEASLTRVAASAAARRDLARVDPDAAVAATLSDAVLGLAARGCYVRAVAAARAGGVGLEDGDRRVAGLLSRAIREHLVPTVATLSRPRADDDDDRDRPVHLPSLARLVRARDAVASDGGPRAPVAAAWRPARRDDAEVRAHVASELCRALVDAHAHAGNTLALDVAEAFLDRDGDRAVLPYWVRETLGDTAATSGSLFARTPGSEGTTAADPAALLRSYVKRGLYASACDLATNVLRGNGYRRTTALRRLPEKGDVDIVPYHTIDLLYQLVQEAVDNNDNRDAAERRTMLAARDRMERALEHHFEMIKMSEMGVLSARALST